MRRIGATCAAASAQAAEPRPRTRAADGSRFDLGTAAGQGCRDGNTIFESVDPQVAFQRRPAETASARGNFDVGGRLRESARCEPFFIAVPAAKSGPFRYPANFGRRCAIASDHAASPGSHSIVRRPGGRRIRQRLALPGLLQSPQALANRSRVMNKERFDLVAQLSALQAKGAVGLEPEHLELRIATLDEIGHQLFERARWIRRMLMSLLISILCMLGCSLCLGLAMLAEVIAAIAPWLFMAGIISMMAGVLAAIEELRRSLKPLLFEHEQIDDLP